MEESKDKELADLVKEIWKTEPAYYSALNGEGNFCQIRIEGHGQKLHSLAIKVFGLIEEGAKYNFYTEKELNQIKAYAQTDFI